MILETSFDELIFASFYSLACYVNFAHVQLKLDAIRSPWYGVTIKMNYPTFTYSS